MRLKAPEFVIDNGDPFKHDLLERMESAEILTELLRSLDEPFVLCIDAPWGQGKSTFLRMWRQHLENERFATLHFNAWENDLEYRLPISVGEKYAGALFKKFGLNEYFGGDELNRQTIQEVVSGLSSALTLSLRDQERVFSRLSVVVRASPDRDWYSVPMAFLLVLDAKKHNFYQKFINGDVGSEEVLDELRSTRKGMEFLSKHVVAVLEAWVICIQRDQKNASSAYGKHREPTSDLDENDINTRSDRVVRVIDEFWHTREAGVLDDLIRRIEIADRFV